MVLTIMLTVRVRMLSSTLYLYLMLLDRKRRDLTYVIGLECKSLLHFLHYLGKLPSQQPFKEKRDPATIA